MRFSFTPEQEEFRSSLRRALEARSPDQGSAPPDGDRPGLRARRLEEAEPGTGPHRHPYSRGLRRQRLRPGRPRHRAGGDGPRASVRALLLDGAGRQRHPECRHGRAEARAAARHRLRRDDRDPGLLRGRRPQRRRGRRHDGRAIRRHLAAGGHQELRARRPHRRPHRRAGAPAGLAGRGRPVVLHRRRQFARPGAAAAQDHGRDAQARAARPSTRSRRGSWARPAPRRQPSPAPCSRPPSCSPTRWWAAPSGCARMRSPTPRCACSSAARSPRSRRRRTRRPTCWSMSSWRSRPPTTPPPRSTRATTSCRRIASLAKACAAEAYLQTAIHAVQMHGGIGFTWDNDTHLWFKRAKSSEILFGDANQHRELMMQHWKH